MAYIGQKVKATLMNDRVVDTMTGDGSDTTLELSSTPISINNTLVFINGIYQRQTTDYTLSGTTITFTEAPFSGAIVCAITGGGEHIGCPMTPMGADKLIDGIATDSKIVGMSASKLSGTLPALDGSALTGINNSISTIAVDPTLTTNPADGVGTLIINSASGEMYVCTDATTDANVWTNVGGGSGNIEPYIFHFTGSTYGFVAGGKDNTNANFYGINIIQKFTFASASNATDHGDLSVDRYWNSGASSSTHGYSTGDAGETSIDKFAFSSNVTAVTHGDIPETSYGGGNARSGTGGHSSETHGFVSGGSGDAWEDRDIFKYSFASNVTASSHGDLSGHQLQFGGVSGPTDGYTTGGYDANVGDIKRIEKFAYSSNTVASSHGDLSVNWRYGTDVSSETYGYVCGRSPGSGPSSSAIEKFAYSSNTTASSHGDLFLAMSKGIGQSEKTQGFISGGSASDIATNVIQKFSYASNTTGTDHSDLFFSPIDGGSGHQV